VPRGNEGTGKVAQEIKSPPLFFDLIIHNPALVTIEKQWDAMVADFKATLNKFKVPQKEQDELIAIVATTKPDIVMGAAAKQ
jgi:hypothetical protein